MIFFMVLLVSMLNATIDAITNSGADGCTRYIGAGWVTAITIIRMHRMGVAAVNQK